MLKGFRISWVNPAANRPRVAKWWARRRASRCWCNASSTPRSAVTVSCSAWATVGARAAAVSSVVMHWRKHREVLAEGNIWGQRLVHGHLPT